MVRVLALALAVMVAVGLGASAQSTPNEDACQPLTSSLASVAIPGAGQWLNGHADQAQFQFSVGLINATLAAIFWGDYGPVAIPAHLIWVGYSAIDAAIGCLRTRQLQRAESIAN